MNIALRRTMTVSEYLDWAAAQSDGPRTELINGQIVPMSPERAAHNRAKIRLVLALRNAIQSTGAACEVFTDGMSVPIDEHTAYEPDALVRCGPSLPGGALQVTDPLIVAEVISPSSAHTDTSAKLIGYFKLPSVRHYLIVDPDRNTVTHHARTNGAISPQVHTTGTLRLDPPGIAVEIAELVG